MAQTPRRGSHRLRERAPTTAGHDGGVFVIGSHEREYFSVAEAAAHLGVSRGSVSRWIRADRLPATHLGQRTTRIARRDLERFLDDRRQGETGGVMCESPSPHEGVAVEDGDGDVVAF
jgi:excisionase family DNA binding protein